MHRDPRANRRLNTSSGDGDSPCGVRPAQDAFDTALRAAVAANDPDQTAVRFWGSLLLLFGALVFSGCGTTKSFEATEQLILSDAVDESISAIDFRPLSGFKVFLDTEYLKAVKNPSFVNAEYVISSLRQQIIGAGCLLQDSKDQADLIIEARVGTLGSDAFQVIYGIPPNSMLSSASQMVPAIPAIPLLPELSFARRESREGAAKIAAFAYDRVTRQPIWQSGVARTSTTARDTWILGVGPIQTGTIRHSTRVIGTDLEFGGTTIEGATPRSLYDRPPVNYEAEVRFENGQPILGPRLLSDGMMSAPNSAGAASGNPGSPPNSLPGGPGSPAATAESPQPSETLPSPLPSILEPTAPPPAPETPALNPPK